MSAILLPKLQNCDPNYNGYMVIGAGLPRTGTLSISSALEILLDGPCYHMRQVLDGGIVEQDHWEKVFNDKVSDEEWKQFLEGRGFRSGVDYPISHHFEYAIDNYLLTYICKAIEESYSFLLDHN